ncbi:MAG: glycosyltransferase family 2 protein [Burkholderiales bacterium]|nr:glycosyltransferase family 2 protein [Burkholderiales bacterium]
MGLTLSVVVPMHNELPNVGAFFARIVPVLESLGERWEIVCVDDGSSDDTFSALLEMHRREPRVKLLRLSRNFGKEAALTAGLSHARGDAVIPIDADLQDPPELIPALLAKWREGFDVVNAARTSRQGETWFKRASARAFYKLFEMMAPIRLARDTGDFRLLSRRVVRSLERLPERSRMMKGLFAWVGFRQAYVMYDRPPRFAGQSQWSVGRLFKLAIDGITSFSAWPLRIWSFVGALIALLAFAYAAFLIVRTLVFGVVVPGYASMMVVLLFVAGVQLMGLGVLGEYLGRVFEEVKQRPLYLVMESRGFEEASGEPRPD